MRIKEIRESRGISQRKAALDLNLSPVVYGRYENGQREPPYITLVAMADYFGVTTDDLLGHSTEMPVTPSPRISLVARGMEGMSDEEQERFLAMARAAFPAVFGDK